MIKHLLCTYKYNTLQWIISTTVHQTSRRINHITKLVRCLFIKILWIRLNWFVWMKSDWYFLTSLLQFRDYLYFSGFILLKRSKILGVNSYRNFTLHFKTLNICIEKNLRTLECMSRSAKQLINIGLRDRDLNLTVYDKTASTFVHRLGF